MSIATDEAGHPGFSPRRRAMTLFTPSAATTTAPLETHGRRAATSSTRSASCRACTTSTPGTSSRPPRWPATQQRVEFHPPDHQAPPDRPTRSRSNRRPGPSDTAGATSCVVMRRSAGWRYGNRVTTRQLMPPPQGLFCGNSTIRAAGPRSPPGPGFWPPWSRRGPPRQPGRVQDDRSDCPGRCTRIIMNDSTFREI